MCSPHEPASQHDEDNPAWYNVGFGRSQSLSYTQIFAQALPENILANGQNQRTTLEPDSAQQIFNEEQNFFRFTRSGVGALEQMPDLNWIFSSDTQVP